jgi:trehalose 6-phosphate phosphatase
MTQKALEPIRARLGQTLVALDFDGTLAPIVEHPEDARALPGTADVLAAVAARVAKVAVITGRPAADAVSFAGLTGVPRLTVLGHYGLERWEAGRLETPGENAGVELARRRVVELAAVRPGVVVEDKGHSVALHTRRAPDPAGALEELTPHAVAIADEAGLQVTPGRYVLELRPIGIDKGTALRALVAETSASAVLFAGDDVGDLPAVAVVRELALNDVVGVVVCSDADEASAQLRAQADVVVAGPAGVLDLLAELATAPSP